MPSHREHQRLQDLILGVGDWSSVNRFLDWPIRFMGRKHRRLLHDITAPFIVGLLFQEEQATLGAAVHILHDHADTRLKRAIKKIYR